MSSGDGRSSDVCPGCRMPFDKAKKRRLVDSCGHQRCYTCMFKKQECPLCSSANAAAAATGKTA